MSLVPMKTYLEPDLAQSVSRMAASQSRSESAIIADFIRARVASGSDEAIKAENATNKRQLNRIEARLDKLIWEQTQFKAALLLFVHVWLKHNPPLDADLEESATLSAEARFARFIDALANELAATGGGDDLGQRLSEIALNHAGQDAEMAP
ncbi:hypothetical protein [Terricaulis silvestris]|uniref:CopG family transcriptional regulator n=1 Tax=Terricaulis silvestris TaxID=2686094 RepID=A0A6I6MIR0_9CAUL|nr:hypothetical protein [Terricaulis silvestris]QGZ94950.1 hypothetical protein DSM104635_01785 [Terricaulis silvestris]